MLYVKLGKRKYQAQISTFNTQFGNPAVRVITKAPTTSNGFTVVDEDENQICDYSDYTYIYRQDGDVKEYTNVEEEIVQAECFEMGDVPDSAYTILSRRISQVNNKVNDITPYTETKVGYYGEKEKVFYNVPSGNVSVFFDNYNGNYSINRVEDRLTISFTELTKTTNITISVQ